MCLLDFESADEKAKKQSGDHDQPKKGNGHPCHCNSGKNKSHSKKGGQKRKRDGPHDGNAKSQPKKRTTSAEGTAKMKGWKGYVQMSKEDFERDLALI